MNIIDTPYMIVEKGKNTSYITSLFVALFYNDSYIQNMLSIDPKNIFHMYLQQLIYSNFVWNMKYKPYIDFFMINEIRNCMIYNGWNSTSNIVDMCNVFDLYEYLVNIFDYKNIITHNLKTDTHTTYSSISHNLTKNTTTSSLIEEWNKINTILNEPLFIIINIIRDDVLYTIDIHNGIYGIVSNKSVWWNINSIICLDKITNEYYTLLIDKNENWLLYDDTRFDAMYKKNIYDAKLAKQIQEECVMIIYCIKKQL